MTEAETVPAWQRRAVMACALMGSLLSNLDGAIANLALPTIARELHASSAATVWVVNCYQLGVAICLLPAAAFGEILGFKRIYAFGLCLFTLASLACALAPSLDCLIAARLAQGVGGACLAALGPALLRAIYPRPMIGGGLAIMALVVAIAGASGPSIAALILSVADWPWLFLVNLPVGLVAIPLFWATAPAHPGQNRPFDLSGALLNAAAIGLMVLGVAGLGAASPYLAWGEVVGGLALFLLLIRQQARRALPLLPLDLMRIPLFAVSVATAVCAYGAQIMAYISLPFLFQTVMHRSAIETGLLVTPWPVMVAVAAPIVGRLSARYRSSVLTCAGSALLMLGLILMAALPAMPSAWDAAWRMGLCGVGFAIFQTPNNMALMTAGPVARNGAASGMVAYARTLGWSLGSALVALIFGHWGPGGTVICLSAAAGFAATGAILNGVRVLTVRRAE